MCVTNISKCSLHSADFVSAGAKACRQILAEIKVSAMTNFSYNVHMDAIPYCSVDNSSSCDDGFTTYIVICHFHPMFKF